MPSQPLPPTLPTHPSHAISPILATKHLQNLTILYNWELNHESIGTCWLVLLATAMPKSGGNTTNTKSDNKHKTIIGVTI